MMLDSTVHTGIGIIGVNKVHSDILSSREYGIIGNQYHNGAPLKNKMLDSGVNGTSSGVTGDKVSTNDSTSFSELDDIMLEKERTYIPLQIAKARMESLTVEMRQMKAKHLTLIDEITTKYEKMNGEARESFQKVLDEVKIRAASRIQENRQIILQLREEIIAIQEKHENEKEDYRYNITTIYTTY